jgi:hypothetical protein
MRDAGLTGMSEGRGESGIYRSLYRGMHQGMQCRAQTMRPQISGFPM